MSRRTTEGDAKQIATNRKAYHDYFLEDSYEAGIALTGTEIKSVRAGSCQPARWLCPAPKRRSLVAQRPYLSV